MYCFSSNLSTSYALDTIDKQYKLYIIKEIN